jgi:FkbM family methyltransferase
MEKTKYTNRISSPLQKRVNTLTGLFRNHLSFNNKIRLFQYYCKRLVKANVSADEENIYYLYSYLVDSRSRLIEELDGEHVIEIGNLIQSVRFYLRTLPSSDQLVYSQVFVYKQYEPVVKMLLESYSPEYPITIMDAGANIGAATIYFKSVFSEAHILSIEPEKSNYNQLVKNITVNGYQNILPVQQALWYREANLRIIDTNGDGLEWSFAVEEINQHSSLKGYDVLHYANLLAVKRIDLLKIDVEGAERYLFQDNDYGAALLDACDFLAIEIHDWGTLRQRIYSLLEKSGFSYWDADELTIAKRMKKDQ